jgi:hypothetical protein
MLSVKSEYALETPTPLVPQSRRMPSEYGAWDANVALREHIPKR